MFSSIRNRGKSKRHARRITTVILSYVEKKKKNKTKRNKTKAEIRIEDTKRDGGLSCTKKNPQQVSNVSQTYARVLTRAKTRASLGIRRLADLFVAQLGLR